MNGIAVTEPDADRPWSAETQKHRGGQRTIPAAGVYEPAIRHPSIPFDPLAGTDEQVGEDGIMLGDLKGELAEVVTGRFRLEAPGHGGSSRDSGLAGRDLNGVER